MSKRKSSDKNHYEMLYIVSNKFSEDELSPIVDKVAKTITDNGGQITLKEIWGKKRMTYSIKGFSYGYYVCIEFDLEGKNLAGIEHTFRMSSEILRHQIVSKHVKTEKEIEKEKVIDEKIAAKAIKAVKEEEAKEKLDEKTDKVAEKKKVDLKDLDEKLDKILESDNLF